MNLSTTVEQSDSKYFSQRSKYMSLLNRQSSSANAKPSLMDGYFQFSNRTHSPVGESRLAPIGRGHGNLISNIHRHNLSIGRSRTTVPVSSFLLQKNIASPTSTVNTRLQSPIIVMHDEIEFVRPYFGTTNNKDKKHSSTLQKREFLLSALKEIETNLKAL